MNKELKTEEDKNDQLTKKRLNAQMSALNEKLQTCDLILGIGERIEENWKKGWDMIDADSIKDPKELKKYEDMRSNSADFFKNIESVLLKIKMWVVHEQRLVKGLIDPFEITRDPNTGLKKMGELKDEDFEAQNKAGIQQKID